MLLPLAKLHLSRIHCHLHIRALLRVILSGVHGVFVFGVGMMAQVSRPRGPSKDPLMEVLQPALKVGAFSGTSPFILFH